MRKTAIGIILIALLLVPSSALGQGLFGWLFGSPEPTPSPAPIVSPEPEITAEPEAVPEAEAVFPSPVPIFPVETMDTEENADIRVFLKSLGSVSALNIVTEGNYTVENDAGFRFDRGSSLLFAADNGNLYLSVGGLTLNMGASATLTRHAAPEGETNGLIVLEASEKNLYCGNLQLTAKEDAIEAVLTLDIEDYLYGVLPYEMADSWPMEALKAQAVAARTYALNRRQVRTAQTYDVVDTTADQVFRGYDPSLENTVSAVDATRGIVGRWHDSYPTCFFTASNGGETALPEQTLKREGDYSYLDAREDPFDLENPYSIVRIAEIPIDGGALPEQLYDALIEGAADQIAGLGFSADRKDWLPEILSIESCEPCDPVFEGTSMYRKIRFGMKMEAVNEDFFQADPTPAPAELPLDADLPPAAEPEAIWETVPETIYVEVQIGRAHV